MKDFRRKDLLFSLCGLNCGLCTMHLDGYCPGCGGGEGNQSCKIAKCSLQHGKIEYCYQCGSFPCERYKAVDEYDSFITHQNMLKDFEKMKAAGAEAYRKEQVEKMEILKDLLDHYNDGRKKTFFCLAVNLLELDDLQTAMETMKKEEQERNLSAKDKAAYLTQLLREAAGQKNIILKLRRKPAKSKEKQAVET